jgi:hypothetical protein
MMFVVVVASACHQPSAPTYVPPPVPFVTRHFSGVVLTEDGQPVPGATVSMNTTATTDGNGFYRLTLYEPAPWAGGYAKVTHPLYENTVTLVGIDPAQTDVTKNFRLFRSVTLVAGESAHLAITPDSSLCDGADEYTEFLCRKVHVTVPSSGTLVLEAIGDDPSNPFWLWIGDIQNSFQNVTHLSTSMDTATTVVVLVLTREVCLCMWRNVGVPGGFTLKTAFAP